MKSVILTRCITVDTVSSISNCIEHISVNQRSGRSLSSHNCLSNDPLTDWTTEFPLVLYTKDDFL